MHVKTFNVLNVPLVYFNFFYGRELKDLVENTTNQ